MNEKVKSLLEQANAVKPYLLKKGASAKSINLAIHIINDMSGIEELEQDTQLLTCETNAAIFYTNKRENILDIGCLLLHDIPETESKHIKNIAYMTYLRCQDVLKDTDRTDCKSWWESVKLMASELYKYSKIGSTNWYSKGEREYHPYHVILEDAINSEEYSISRLERVIEKYMNKYNEDTNKGLFVNADQLLWYVNDIQDIIKKKKFSELKSEITGIHIKVFSALDYYIETYDEMMKDEFFKGKVDNKVAKDIELFRKILKLYDKDKEI